jgi:hypothetical protein
MYSYSYADPFLQHTYLHHLSRVDHRHNFSPYNTLLHLTSSPMGHSSTPFASIPFFPQLLLSGLVIPLAFAKHDLPATMFAQTFAFVSFNKVCTSQYFMWYIVLLPFYLPGSVLLRRPWLGGVALVLWVVSQVLLLPARGIWCLWLLIGPVFTGGVVTTRLRIGVSREVDVRSGLVGCVVGVFCGECLAVGGYCG